MKGNPNPSNNITIFADAELLTLLRSLPNATGIPFNNLVAKVFVEHYAAEYVSMFNQEALDKAIKRYSRNSVQMKKDAEETARLKFEQERTIQLKELELKERELNLREQNINHRDEPKEGEIDTEEQIRDLEKIKSTLIMANRQDKIPEIDAKIAKLKERKDPDKTEKTGD